MTVRDWSLVALPGVLMTMVADTKDARRATTLAGTRLNGGMRDAFRRDIPEKSEHLVLRTGMRCCEGGIENVEVVKEGESGAGPTRRGGRMKRLGKKRREAGRFLYRTRLSRVSPRGFQVAKWLASLVAKNKLPS